jgi:hypothetical protein
LKCCCRESFCQQKGLRLQDRLMPSF